MRPTALDDGALLADPTLHALYEFTELIAANVRSNRQRERVMRASPHSRVPHAMQHH